MRKYAQITITNNIRRYSCQTHINANLKIFFIRLATLICLQTFKTYRYRLTK
ncbi:hypothetical protein HMPREF1579_00513 [Gardnerella vaginalis JCP8066]|nr:hypothetical protein HMPREF1579_00513 [Gardnerella vaginalis JCP8066]